ncbi:MAG: hypothetical protein LBG11_10735 [Bifidobacteriaceae bacterium]|jgi:predicted amidohydrolase|nr:hypothetical protein [Bifidobacteriaceae bacterium]
MVAVGQLAPGPEAEANWSVALRLIERAAASSAKLLVLPEQTMLNQQPGDPAAFARLADQTWAWWPEALAKAARRFSIALVAGGFASSEDEDPRPSNVLVAVNAVGQVVAIQPKTRLYDAFSYRESEMVRPGPPDAGAPVELAGLRLGLINCYELRFPERARALVAAGAEVLTLSAAWVRGPLKEDHWLTLARARAIENCAYLLAAGTRAKDTIGRSMIIDPGGVIRAGLADEPEGIALAEIDSELVAATRARTASLP